MKICLLIDGSENPVTLRLNDDDVKKPFIAWGRAGQPTQNFKFTQDEGKNGFIKVYRLIGDNQNEGLSDERFLESMTLEVDKILDPDKFRKLERENESRRRQAAA